jgi:hypothetical protein
MHMANLAQRNRERRRDMAISKGVPPPPDTEYSFHSDDELSLVTDHSMNQNGPLFLLSGANPHWSGYAKREEAKRSQSVPVLRGGQGTITRTGPDKDVAITPGLCGTLQFRKFQNNRPYLATLDKERTAEERLSDPQAPTRTLDGRDPFRADADGATNYLPRHRNPPEDVSQVGVWKMKTVLGKVIWFLDLPPEAQAKADMSFQDSLAAFREDFQRSERQKYRATMIRRGAKTYKPRNMFGAHYTQTLGCL